MENFESNGCARRRCIASFAEQRTGEATYARGRKCENALELRGRAPAEFPGQAMHGALRAAGAREVGLCPDEIEHTGQQETALWARWGAHRETRGRRRVGSALEWQERRERKKRERTRASGRCACEKEEREEEDERERKKRERRSERSERVTRVTTLWRGVKNTSTRASM